jgi:hypothetical protein
MTGVHFEVHNSQETHMDTATRARLTERGFVEIDPGQWRRDTENPFTEACPYVFLTAWDGTGIDDASTPILAGFYDLTDEKICQMGFANVNDFLAHWDT